METLKAIFLRGKAWALKDENRARAKLVAEQVNRAFTEHPKEAGETYVEHLIFTLKITSRLLFGGTALLVHGLFPFLCTKTASTQVEKIYAIMRSRIPQQRLEEIERDWQI